MLAQGPSRADDVGDRVGDPELDRDLDCAVEADDLGCHPPRREVVAHQVRIRRRDALTAQIVDAPLLTCGSCIAEGRGPEAHRELLVDLGTRVASEITTGDAEIERARADVDGDVFGSEEEELDVVVDVEDGEILRVGSFAVTRLGQHGGGRLGEGTFVGDCNAQHGHSRGYR